MDLNHRKKLIEIAQKMGVTIVPVKNRNDIYTKCDGFTMITNFSNKFKKNIDIRDREKASLRK